MNETQSKRKKQNQKPAFKKTTIDKVLTGPITEKIEKMQIKLTMKKGK